MERGRIAADAFEKFVGELSRDSPAFMVVPLDSNIANALKGIPRDLVPDMPDASSLQLPSTLAFPLLPAIAASNPPKFRQSGRSMNATTQANPGERADPHHT